MSLNYNVIEVWYGMTIAWEPGWSLDDGVMEVGDPDHVEGQCNNCDHSWRFRGINQMDDMNMIPPKPTG